jgi:hypothetical protein
MTILLCLQSWPPTTYSGQQCQRRSEPVFGGTACIFQSNHENVGGKPEVSYLLDRRFHLKKPIANAVNTRKRTQNRARTRMSIGTRPWFRLRLCLRVVQRKVRWSSKRLQSHSGQAPWSLRQAKLRPESMHVGLLVSQKKAMEVRALSAHCRGFVQNTQMTVFRSIRFGTTEPPVEVQKPMTMGTRTAATCTCIDMN